MTQDIGASVGPGSREPNQQAVSALPGFDPSRDELDQLIESIEALYNAATPGEWVWYQNGWAPNWTGEKIEFVHTESVFNGVGAGDLEGGDWAVTAFQGDGLNGENNSRFIACAKNWMPALIECARTVREMKRFLPASGIEARSDETAQRAQPERQEPGPQGDAQNQPGAPA